MRTSIEIDDALLEEAFSFSKAKTKKRFDSRGSHRIRPAQKAEGSDRIGWPNPVQ